jgi:hypothetical protein
MASRSPGLVYLAGGASLAILAIRVFQGQWDGFWGLAACTAVANLSTALVASLCLKTSDVPGIDRAVLIACYAMGAFLGGTLYVYSD